MCKQLDSKPTWRFFAGSALGGELAGLLDFLNRIPREALSTDEEAARKHYVELCKDMHKRKLARPPELPPRPLGGQLEAGMRTKSVPDCRVDAGMELGTFCCDIVALALCLNGGGIDG